MDIGHHHHQLHHHHYPLSTQDLKRRFYYSHNRHRCLSQFIILICHYRHHFRHQCIVWIKIMGLSIKDWFCFVAILPKHCNKIWRYFRLKYLPQKWLQMCLSPRGSSVESFSGQPRVGNSIGLGSPSSEAGMYQDFLLQMIFVISSRDVWDRAGRG